MLRKLMRNKESSLGGSVFLIITAAALLAPILPVGDPIAQNLDEVVRPPSWNAEWRMLMGTDQLGRGMLSRLVYGARVSLVVALASVLVAGAVGVPFGLLGGYYGGILDAVLMRLAEIQLAFPPVLLALGIVASFGTSLLNVILAVAATSWVPYARVVRASTLSLREREFVHAGRALGAQNLRIILQHVLPNIITPLIVIATLQIGRAIITESALSFLGLGVPPPAPSLGGMLADARNYMFAAWWLPTLPGLLILLSVLSINLMGDGIRWALDPKLRY
jgi:peptide/nickel transport system permease protein